MVAVHVPHADDMGGEVHHGGAGAEWYTGERAEVHRRQWCWDALQLSGICGRCGKQSSLPAGPPQGLIAAAAAAEKRF